MKLMAVAAMKALNVYDQAASRLVYGENIAQTAQFVESGAAGVGILAHSLAIAPKMRDEGRFWQVPLSSRFAGRSVRRLDSIESRSSEACVG
jgi:molybdate transport system substrate-binding protein